MTAKRKPRQREGQSTGGSHLVFVDGTLRRGFWNHDLLAKSVFLGSGKTKHRYAMDVDAIPSVVKEAVSCVLSS
jgi:gamma-glutamylcyclotransferase (GGCT)/AIG2-like uncharacterized protein YtfP